MPFMGTDLSKIMKHEKLTEDRIQFLVYQMLKGLKVCRFCYYFDFTIFFFLVNHYGELEILIL